jgi:hypothetical protein
MLYWAQELAGSHDEPSGSITGGQFLDYMSDWYLLNKDCVPWIQLLNPSLYHKVPELGNILL